MCRNIQERKGVHELLDREAKKKNGVALGLDFIIYLPAAALLEMPFESVLISLENST